MTSAVMFGGVLVAVVTLYLVTLSQAQNLTQRAKLITDAGLDASGNVLLRLDEFEFRTIESFVIEGVLRRLTFAAVVALVAVFAMALVLGWYIAGRALRPIDELTAVAREIEATDLSRRIGITGPDDEISRMAGTFDSMLDRLDAAFRGQKESLAQTSHDLRTPLAVIRSNLEVTMSDDRATVDDWRATGAIALRAAERMSGMVEDLLVAARLEAGTPTLVSVDLADLVAEIFEDYSARFIGAGLTGVAHNEKAQVSGERRALSRAVENLIDNAVRASPPAKTVVLASGRVDGWAYLRSRGLGLSIVRQIARLHGGWVDASTRSGGGSVVVLWIPTGAVDPASKPPMSALPDL
jgi:signal transduction histidine kinase